MAYPNSKAPVILLAFANDDGRSLRQLDEEQRDLRQVFEQARKEGKCEIVVLPAATAADIIRAFQTYRNRIKVFHYGGHSSKDKIFLKAPYRLAKEVDAESLAGFLASQNQLELVFLNSCLSFAQAETYYLAGSKAVIATEIEIGDHRARVFARLFYTGLTTGASIDQAYREAEKGFQVQIEDKYRGIGKNKDDVKSTFHWQLYPRGPHTWRLPLMVQRLTRIPTIILEEEFIGREEDLQRLSHLLDQSSQVLLINGIGGIGKTVLATAYINTHANEYDHLVWINRGEDLIQSVSLHPELADTLNLPFQKEEGLQERFRRILWALQQIPGRNLLVIDNAQTQVATEEVRQHLPGPPYWRVLMISRMDLAGFEQLRLETLSLQAAKLLFRRHFKGATNDAELQELLEEIGCHTLTTELLARLLARLNKIVSVPELIDILRQKQLNDPDLQHRVWARYSGEERGIFLHLMKAFEMSQLDQQEIQLLKYFVVLPVESYSVLTLSDFLKERPLRLNITLNSLSTKGWLTLHENNTFSIHRLIRQVADYQLQPDLLSILPLLDGMIEKMDVDPYSSNVMANAPWIANATAIDKYFATEHHEKLAKLQNNIADTYRTLGQYREELNYRQKALVIEEQELEADDPNLTASYNNLALAFRALGQYEQAMSYHQKDMGVLQKILDPDHPDLATSYNNIAQTYRDLGQYEQAISCHQKALDIREKVLDKSHPHLAQSYNNIALSYRDLGKYEQALFYHLKDLAIMEEIMEANHPRLATSYNNIALTYSDLEQYEKALRYHQKDLAILESKLSANHPDLATSYNNIAETYRSLEQYDKALSFHLKGQLIAKSVLPANHPDLAISYNNLALTYLELEQYEKALSCHQKAILIRESELPDLHPILAQSYSNIAQTYTYLGEFKQALTHHQKALAIMELVLNADHPDLATAYCDIAKSYDDLEDYEQALTYYHKGLELMEAFWGASHPDLSMAYNDIALIYSDLGQYEQALSYHQKDLAISEAMPEANPQNLAISYDNIADTYHDLGQEDKAREYEAKAARIREEE